MKFPNAGQLFSIFAAALLCFMALIGWAGYGEIQFRNWISELDRQATAFDGHVNTGRRDSSRDVLVYCHSEQTDDKKVADIVMLARQCLDNGEVKEVIIDLSKTSVSDRSISELSKLNGVIELNVSQTRLTSSGIEELRTRLESTRIVSGER